MAKQIVLLSGPICSGKSTLCHLLEEHFGLATLKTKDCIRELASRPKSGRVAFQNYGDYLDRKTNGTWVRDALASLVNSLNEDAIILVDAVRVEAQINAIRLAYGPRVVHIHLTAPADVLAARYGKRKTELKEPRRYADVRKNKTEQMMEELARSADVVVDTVRCTEGDVLVKTACHLGLYGREYLRLVDVLIGGQYGSEGKGQIVCYLAREYEVLVRVGGPNAGHTVYEEPKAYTFHHLPSGSRSSNARLLIGPGATIYVPKLLEEIADCGVDSTRLSIDPQAMIITEKDRQAEKDLKAQIGSTGQGVGAAMARRIMGRLPKDPAELARDIPDLRPFIRDAREVLDGSFRNRERVLVEGTQGTGLSLYHGSYPHVTSRDTTVAGCLAEAGISPSRVRKAIMVCRTYPIRVQSPDGEGLTSGPMLQEIDFDEIAKRSGLDAQELSDCPTRGEDA